MLTSLLISHRDCPRVILLYFYIEIGVITTRKTSWGQNIPFLKEALAYC